MTRFPPRPVVSCSGVATLRGDLLHIDLVLGTSNAFEAFACFMLLKKQWSCQNPVWEVAGVRRRGIYEAMVA